MRMRFEHAIQRRTEIKHKKAKVRIRTVSTPISHKCVVKEQRLGRDGSKREADSMSNVSLSIALRMCSLLELEVRNVVEPVGLRIVTICFEFHAIRLRLQHVQHS